MRILDNVTIEEAREIMGVQKGRTAWKRSKEYFYHGYIKERYNSGENNFCIPLLELRDIFGSEIANLTVFYKRFIKDCELTVNEDLQFEYKSFTVNKDKEVHFIIEKKKNE